MSNVEIATSFVDTWRNQHPGRLASELLSLHNETNRKPDPSTFLVSNEGLVDQETGKPIKEFIRHDTPLYEREYQAFATLEGWARDTEDDVAIWIPPAYPGQYPCAKINLSRVCYDWNGQKYLLNTTILFGDQATDCVGIVPNCPIDDPEKLRGALFVVDEETTLTILGKIEEYGIYSEEDINRDEEIAHYVDSIREGISAQTIINQMRQTGFLGQHSISCPPASARLGFSDYMTRSSTTTKTDKWEYHKGTCRDCGRENVNVGPCNICQPCEKKYQ